MSDLLPSSSSDAPFLAGADFAAENRLLRRIIEATAADLDIREVAQRVAALMTDATGADVCFVHLVDEERGRVVLCGATPPFDEAVGTVELALGEGIAGWVAQHAEPAVVPDKWKDARYKYIPALRGEDYTSMLSVPMLVRGKVVGVLNVHAKTTRNWDEQDVALLSDVANNMARAVENARLYASLAQREEMLENFAARTVEAQEHERRRLAGEIHDGISQRLISLWYHLLAAEDAVAGLRGPNAVGGPDGDRLRSELDAAKELATDALTEARTAITGLRPAVLDDLGLGPSLESLARSLANIQTDIDITPADLPPHVEMALYRIAQEALHNVVRHSGASQVTVVFGPTEDGGARLIVADDGTGLPEEWVAVAEERGAYGLVGIRERADLIGATLSINSRPGLGTTVEVAVAPAS